MVNSTQQYTAAVVQNRCLGNKRYYLTFEAGPIAQKGFRAGQFVYLRSFHQPEPLLRRAFSIASGDFEKNTLSIYFDVKGRGTARLSALRPGDSIDVLGPLGNGFDKAAYASTSILVAGGCGVAPILALAREIKTLGKDAVVCYGARSKEALVLVKALRRAATRLVLATEDGSAGKKGKITEWLPQTGAPVFACGPTPMLKALAHIRPDTSVAVEARMACGLGVCNGCTVPMQDGTQKRCCVDGPVFNVSEVAWNLL